MSIRCRCTQCGQALFAPDGTVGRWGKCPKCGERTQVLGPDSATSGPDQPRLAETKPLEIVTNSIGMKLVLIPAGEFLMGSPESEVLYDSEGHVIEYDDKPQHRVRITRPFYLGLTQVTQQEYLRVNLPIRCKFRDEADRPVESVSWKEAVAFCRKLSEKEGYTYRLPTEAEWEYACRAGSTTEWCFGDDDYGLIEEYAWYRRNSKGGTQPVGQKKANAWGLHDMHGNVSEWCADWYDEEYYKESPVEDPRGPDEGSDLHPERVLRGGNWREDYPAGSASRSKAPPGGCLEVGGFRVARTLTP